MGAFHVVLIFAAGLLLGALAYRTIFLSRDLPRLCRAAGRALRRRGYFLRAEMVEGAGKAVQTYGPRALKTRLAWWKNPRLWSWTARALYPFQRARAQLRVVYWRWRLRRDLARMNYVEGASMVAP